MSKFLQGLYGPSGHEKPAAAGGHGRFCRTVYLSVSLWRKFSYKKQIATAPMCRGSFVWGCPYRSLGCQSQSAKIISSRSPVMNLFSIVHITLLSYSRFTPVLYASPSLFASFKLDVFHNFARCLFGSLHSAYCVFWWGTL